MSEPVRFVDIDWTGRRVRIEHQWIAPQRTQSPLIVFLHEGLGSLSMWKDFPQRLCDAAAAESCPVFLGVAKKLHWSTPDPAKALGTDAEIDAAFDEAFNMLKERIQELLK